MKPGRFEYHRPANLDTALALLAEFEDEDVRVLAGGQSLMPMMAFRLAQPGHLVDINCIEALSHSRCKETEVCIGATVRHADFEKPIVAGPLGSLMSRIAREIAHYPIRQRGTFCGSLVHADPASEWCLTAVTLGATIELRSHEATRLASANEFLLDGMTTDLGGDEMVTEVRLPLLAHNALCGFSEFSRRPGDFAQSMVLAVASLEEGRIAIPRMGVGGIEELPRRLSETESLLAGRVPSPELFSQAADCAANEVAPAETDETLVAYRRGLVRETALAALNQWQEGQDVKTG